MSPSANKPSLRRGYSPLDAQLDKLLEQREEQIKIIDSADKKRATSEARAQTRWQNQVGAAPDKLVAVDDKLTAFMERHRDQLTRRLSKTIQRAQGEVKVALRTSELDMPRDESPMVRFFLNRPGGKEKYLIPTWKVNRRAVLQAPPKLFAELVRRFGVWRGKHWTITVKSPTSGKLVTLSRKRSNQR